MTEVDTPAPLAPMPDDWERCHAIVAHPDDLEYGASAAVATWTNAGTSAASSTVNITDTFERGIASLGAHRVYLEGLGDGVMSEPASFLRRFAEQTASRFNGRLATSFELLEM